ncbi:MAG: TfoX/Sxy family protein [Candidatus Dormibacteraeota bacterium]|nr:TfoX/Sxy family protein [Candidatus Dormibacteraeota bacterium]
MAVDEELRAKVREHLSTLDHIEERRIFGGAGFMWRGNLLCGVMGEDLLLRIAKNDFDRFIDDAGARPMVMAGQSSKRWILVQGSVVASQPEMKKWIDRALEFVGSLPAK